METIQKLKDIYSKKGICLGLGAGISVQSGIPLWNDLLKRTSLKIFKTEDIHNDFVKNEYSYEAFASFLKNQDSEKFPQLLRDSLYEDFEFYKKNITKVDKRKKEQIGVGDYKLTTVYQYFFSDFKEELAHSDIYDVYMLQKLFELAVQNKWIEFEE